MLDWEGGSLEPVNKPMVAKTYMGNPHDYLQEQPQAKSM